MIIYVYILQCSDKSYYVGTARGDLERRINQHNSGALEGYTSQRRPVQLVFAQEFEDPLEAIAMERRLKGWRREKKEALIAGKFHLLPKLAKTSKSGHPSTGSG